MTHRGHVPGAKVICALCHQRVTLIIIGVSILLETHGPANNPCNGSRIDPANNRLLKKEQRRRGEDES